MAGRSDEMPPLARGQCRGDEICRHISPVTHAVILPDDVGWNQLGSQVRVPDNLNLLLLPHYSPPVKGGREGCRSLEAFAC